MFCTNCGREIPESDNYCPQCGVPVQRPVTQGAGNDASTLEVEGITGTADGISGERGGGGTPGPALAPPPPAPGELEKESKGTDGSRKALLLAIPLILLVLAGLAVGIFFLVRSGGSTLRAEIRSVELEMSDGGRVGLESVPLGKDLTAVVDYLAEFPEKGEGELSVKFVDSQKDVLLEDSEDCRSDSNPQTFEWEFYMEESLSEEPLELIVELEVRDDGEKLTDKESIDYVAGKSAGDVDGSARDDGEFDQAYQQAYSRVDEAISATNDLVESGIDATGITELLDKAVFKLENGTTVADMVGETDSAVFYANAAINECESRRSAQASQQDSANCQKVMLDYAVANSAPLANMHLEGFTINDAHTVAEATVVGTITAHMDPDSAGTELRSRIKAEKQGGRWVVTYFGTG